MTAPRRSLRGGPVVTPSPMKPRCRVHHDEMAFIATTLRWECITYGCASVAYPKIEEDGNPIMGRGDVELVAFRDEDGDMFYYLRAGANNVMVPLVGASVVDGKAVTEVMLRFTSVTKIDQFGQRRRTKR